MNPFDVAAVLIAVAAVAGYVKAARREWDPGGGAPQLVRRGRHVAAGPAALREQGVERYGSTACPTLISRNAPLISRDAGRVTVRVIRTDEELMIARSVVRSCVDGFP